MTTCVLVHGGWHGGWCWDAVAARLRAAGHAVYAPSLTGLAERAHLIGAVTGPETHVADITQLIAFHDLRDVVLVGHSYAGMVITGAASRRPERVAHLVYLDAFVPTGPGQAARDFAPPARRAEMEAAIQPDGHIAPNGFARWAADPATQDRLRARCTPHPGACFGAGLDLGADPNALDLQRHYLICARHDPSPFQQFYARYKDDPAWRAARLDCLHDAMIEAPGALADYLTRLT